MKISEITVNDVLNYLRLDADSLTPGDITLIGSLIKVSKDYIKSHTGLDDTQADTHEDFAIVVYILCQDMYDNRSMYVDKNNMNKVVDTILGMHTVNLL